MSTQDGRDDRQHGHAIRRRQGGRTSIYHEQLYPVAARHKALLTMTEAQESPWGIRASDTSTGAY